MSIIQLDYTGISIESEAWAVFSSFYLILYRCCIGFAHFETHKMQNRNNIACMWCKNIHGGIEPFTVHTRFKCHVTTMDTLWTVGWWLAGWLVGWLLFCWFVITLATLMMCTIPNNLTRTVNSNFHFSLSFFLSLLRYGSDLTWLNLRAEFGILFYSSLLLSFSIRFFFVDISFHCYSLSVAT